MNIATLIFGLILLAVWVNRIRKLPKEKQWMLGYLEGQPFRSVFIIGSFFVLISLNRMAINYGSTFLIVLAAFASGYIARGIVYMWRH